MPIVDPGAFTNSTFAYKPRAEFITRKFDVEGVVVPAGTSTAPGPDVEIYRSRVFVGNALCIGVNCVSIGPTGVSGKYVDVIPQLSNDRVAWRDVSVAHPAAIRFSPSPMTNESGLGYWQAFVGAKLPLTSPTGVPDFQTAFGPAYVRVILRSSINGASGVFDAMCVVFVFP